MRGFVRRALNVRGNQYETGVSWRKIKAEYIAGGISQRKLAEKYGVNPNLLMRHANKEGWNAKRKAAESKALEKVEQKTAEIVADNAVLLERIKTKLLTRLDKMVDAYPDNETVEIKKRTVSKGSSTEKIYRMKDIAAIYAALEDKTTKTNADIEDLSPLAELLKL